MVEQVEMATQVVDNIGSGAGPTNSGGSGGGYVKIDATGGTITINSGGEIRVDGNNGSTDAAGGVAGGGIYLITSTLDGCGTLSAKGGNGTTNGGGGGGGLIAYYYDTDDFSACGTIDVSGGSGLNSGGSGEVIPENLWLFLVLMPFLPKIFRKRLNLARIQS